GGVSRAPRGRRNLIELRHSSRQRPLQDCGETRRRRREGRVWLRHTDGRLPLQADGLRPAAEAAWIAELALLRLLPATGSRHVGVRRKGRSLPDAERSPYEELARRALRLWAEGVP